MIYLLSTRCSPCSPYRRPKDGRRKCISYQDQRIIIREVFIKVNHQNPYIDYDLSFDRVSLVAMSLQRFKMTRSQYTVGKEVQNKIKYQI